MADDKVRELAEKTAGDTHHLMHYVAVNQAERILRAEFKPLLDALEDARGALCAWQHVKVDPASLRELAQPTIDRLAAELRNWRKE